MAVPLETATVVTLYLLPSANLALRSKLLGELATGARAVSHAFDMGDWSLNEVLTVNGHRLFVWPIDDRARGHCQPGRNRGSSSTLNHTA